MMAEHSSVRWVLTVTACVAMLAACASQGSDPRDGTIVNGGFAGTSGTAIDPVTGLPTTNIDPVTGLPTTDDPTGAPIDPITGLPLPPTATPITSIGSTPIPCDVASIVQNNCQTCHGASLIGGAPMPLVTHEDWHRDVVIAGLKGASVALKGQTMKAYEIAKLRINEQQSPMPPTGAMDPIAFSALDTWLTSGAVAGTDPSCMPATGGDPLSGAANYCDTEDAFGLTLRDPLVARPGEKCYNFLTHGANGVNDTSPFQIVQNESYSEVYYTIPWGPGEVMTRFGADFDNLPVLHHYLVFSNHAGTAPGSVLYGVTGTTLFTNSRLIAGWAVGGCGQEYPEDVGMWLPDPGDGQIMIQWHHFNTTPTTQPDNSIVQICTVPASARPNVGDVTHLGTEFDGRNLPPGASNFTTDCKNNSGADAYVVGWMPHMHLMGVNMKTDIKRVDGTIVPVFEQPFKFDYQIGYPQRPVLKVAPGETLITTCSFMNTTGSNIAFGQSTTSEMCYQFASYYPINSLVNGVLSLLGSTNTCWGPVR